MPSLDQVSTNGYIVFGRPLRFCCPNGPLTISSPNYIIAPFWSDADPRQFGLVRYSVFEGSNSTEIQRISDATSALIGSDFVGTWMMIVDWVEVPQFGNVGNGTVVSLLSLVVCTYKCSDRNL